MDGQGSYATPWQFKFPSSYRACVAYLVIDLFICETNLTFEAAKMLRRFEIMLVQEGFRLEQHFASVASHIRMRYLRMLEIHSTIIGSQQTYTSEHR